MEKNRENISNRKNYISLFYIIISIFAISISAINSFIKPLDLYDEGFSLTNALRILQGDVPHLDYWAAYPPGTSFTLAVFFYFFEPLLLVSRFVNLGWTLLLLSSLFFLLRQFSSIRLTLAATVITSMWISTSMYPSYSGTPALALILISLVLFFKGIRNSNKKTLALGGAFAGCAVLFRHDFSGYLFFSIAFSFFITAISAKYKKEKTSKIKDVLIFLVPFSAVSFSALIFVFFFSGWDNFIQQAIVFPATGMRENRILPYPAFFDFFSAWKWLWLLAWIVPCVVFIGLINQWIKRANQDFFNTMATYTFAVMSLLLTLQAHNRLDMSHAAPSMIFSICFLITLISNKSFKESIFFKIISLILIGLFFIYSLYVTSGSMQYRSLFKCINYPFSNFCMKIQENQKEIVEYVNKNYPTTDYVFIGNTRHDKIYINDASLYFLLKRPIAVKWNEMHPGVATTNEVQKSIIKQLKEKKMHFVILADMPDSKENNASSISSEVYELDNYIKNSYKKVFSNTKYQVLEPKVVP